MSHGAPRHTQSTPRSPVRLPNGEPLRGAWRQRRQYGGGSWRNVVTGSAASVRNEQRRRRGNTGRATRAGAGTGVGSSVTCAHATSASPFLVRAQLCQGSQLGHVPSRAEPGRHRPANAPVPVLFSSTLHSSCSSYSISRIPAKKRGTAYLLAGPKQVAGHGSCSFAPRKRKLGGQRIRRRWPAAADGRYQDYKSNPNITLPYLTLKK